LVFNELDGVIFQNTQVLEVLEKSHEVGKGLDRRTAVSIREMRDPSRLAGKSEKMRQLAMMILK
jgi:hypothetical protein